ncbi:response regulator [Clostridium cellulovorans]|uniref:Stage 0 sporulation protein A homolog n=1 Tax=Clostridium cellulovorans (strain ATCC 35296 / DSM 3052 / OCM 3 / 743B) TaxID=573061 RepID=D9SWA9_CLOC7|nr:response regulator transcription factor [Clostridium cellulovorans]ADL51253.1 two component transcriptional regulator, LuxR family [Clostridium cellulovorans 743B]
MNIVIVDDHPVVRKGIKFILANEKNIEEVKEASNIEEALNIIKNEEIEIAIIDLVLNKEDGLDIIAKAKELGLGTKFILLSSSISQEDFKRASKLGVDGYILKEAFVEDILYAISIISRGMKYYYSEVLKQNGQLDQNSMINQLTEREKDVLTEIRKGLSNEEIAKVLYISEHTVKKHVSNILSKFNLSNRTQVAFMVNNKLSG